MPHPDTLCREEVESASGPYEVVETGGCAPAVQASTETASASEHRNTITVPADIMKTAESTLDRMLCNCKEAGDVRHDSIMDIARALFAERQAQRERDAETLASIAAKHRQFMDCRGANAIEGCADAIRAGGDHA